MVQKIYSKMHLVSCTNTHRDVTDLVNHEMVKNTKTWISWERNIIFLQNKKFLICALDGTSWESYRLVAEVTFKEHMIQFSAFHNIFFINFCSSFLFIYFFFICYTGRVYRIICKILFWNWFKPRQQFFLKAGFNN